LTEKTRLEEDLELVQTRGRRWGVAIILLLVLLLGALAYSVSLNKKLVESERRIESLTLEIDSLRIKMEALRIDAMKCTEGEKETEGGESPPGSPPGEKKGQEAETVQDVPSAPSGEGLRP
jgi:hypothetical protein